jgi:hypothetical protein
LLDIFFFGFVTDQDFHGGLLAEAKINNRDLPGAPADPCLEGEDIHKNILPIAKADVNDINQAGRVLIVLDALSDKKI